ncbi:MAG TPA: hypothetical protein VE133_14790 [Candidatus Sulfotelmatobacter sp.]|nr:hypothetical protein [Candidatus Sulfotelmatobacter sp.]
MKVLFVLLVLSIAAIVVAAGAMSWRLRWHLRRPHVIPPAPALEMEPEQPVEKM